MADQKRSSGQAFLGTGWRFPLSFEPHTGIATVSGKQAIEQSLYIILNTNPGERVTRPEFGCDTSEFIFDHIDLSQITRLEDVITQAIITYEHRIDLHNIEVIAEPSANGVLQVSIDYTIRMTNSRHNTVFPFYSTEGAGQLY